MTADQTRTEFGSTYAGAEIARDTVWVYKAGNPVYLLRTPQGAVWVNQEYTKDVDKDLAIDSLDQLAGKLTLPQGWTAGEGTLSQDLFFSFVTMTTVGYGNLVPAANPGQTFAVLEAVTGQLFLVVAVGKIISSMRPVRDRSRP